MAVRREVFLNGDKLRVVNEFSRSIIYSCELCTYSVHQECCTVGENIENGRSTIACDNCDDNSLGTRRVPEACADEDCAVCGNALRAGAYVLCLSCDFEVHERCAWGLDDGFRCLMCDSAQAYRIALELEAWGENDPRTC